MALGQTQWLVKDLTWWYDLHGISSTTKHETPGGFQCLPEDRIYKQQTQCVEVSDMDRNISFLVYDFDAMKRTTVDNARV